MRNIPISLSLSYLMFKKSYNTTKTNINTTINALCILYPDNNSSVNGLVSFS